MNNIILSVAGRHAQEPFQTILDRKINDINLFGFCFWKFSSYNLKFGAELINPICYFVESNNSIDTKITQSANQYSIDGASWLDIPDGMSPITGLNLKRKQNTCLFLEGLKAVQFEINLLDYTNTKNNEPISRFYMGGSTVCSVKKDNNTTDYKYRKVIAQATLKYPYIVLIK